MFDHCVTMSIIGVSAVVVEGRGGYHEVQEVAEGEVPYLSFSDLVLLPQISGLLPLECVLAHRVRTLCTLRSAR
jgi:hypothetical protein